MTDWDARYRDSETRLFGAEPNDYLRSVVERTDVRPKSALCLGDGDGRNGCWLARQGLGVTAVDISNVATELARGYDAEAGVRVERIAADLADWEPPAEQSWDMAVMLYLQCERDVRHRAVRMAGARLSEGGWFVAEGFSADGAEAGGLGPKKPDLLYDLAGLLECLQGFEIAETFQGTTHLDEGARHQGDAVVSRFLAWKPPR